MNHNDLGELRFASLFDESRIMCSVKQMNRDAVIRALVERLGSTGCRIEAAAAAAAVIERENLVCTAISPGLAIPHARLHDLDEVAVTVATSREGISFGSEAMGPAHLVILILTPMSAPGAYLQALSAVARFFSDPQTARKVATLKSAADVWEFFDRGAIALPEYVRACDIMNSDFLALKETDVLKKAIDYLAQYPATDLPVIDDDGDIVGIVTEEEILRISLPEHLLWLEDLSPIIHFEPFAEVLKSEEQTKIADVMSDRYVSLDENAPAIEVARLLMRREVRQLMVTSGRRLVGTITMSQFITSALRG